MSEAYRLNKQEAPEQLTIDDFLTVKFKPCPFCGHPVHVIMGGSIHCSTCRALVIIAGTGEDIISTWNKRRK